MRKKSPIMETGVEIFEFETIAISKYNQINNKNICRFDNIDLSNLAKDCNDNAMACPDQYVGIININKNGCVSSWNVGWAEESVSKKTKKDREKSRKNIKIKSCLY